MSITRHNKITRIMVLALSGLLFALGTSYSFAGVRKHHHSNCVQPRRSAVVVKQSHHRHRNNHRLNIVFLHRFDFNRDGCVSRAEEIRARRSLARLAGRHYRNSYAVDRRCSHGHGNRYCELCYAEEVRYVIALRLDLNNDGYISVREKNYARRNFRRNHRDTYRLMLEQYDYDNNGYLSDREWSRALEVSRKREVIRRQMLRELDRDGDGYLSDYEEERYPAAWD